jgi:hypothetical protein
MMLLDPGPEVPIPWSDGEVPDDRYEQ